MSALAGLRRFDKPAKGEWITLNRKMLRPRKAADMVLFSSELGRLWGTANREMADFLVDLYDGKDVDYETKGSTTLIQSPLATLLGATVPTSLAAMLPENAANHGILSRIIFVYADKIHKLVPLPPEPTEEWLELRDRIVERLHWIDGCRRDFGLSQQARDLYEHKLYTYTPKIDDPRFEYYGGRRANILLRVAMCICALRSDTWVIESDIQLAHTLLAEIEPEMPKALSAFGRNKAHMARTTIISFLRGQPNHTATIAQAIAAAAADLTKREAEEVIQAMAQKGEVTLYAQSIVLGKVTTRK